MKGLLGSTYGRLGIGLILLGTAFHLWDSTRLELAGDEAYYWLWSRHLDICYLDKGPMIAWLIRAGTSLFGQTVLGVRFFGVLLAGGTGLGLFLLAKQLFSDRVGFWAVTVGLFTPLFAVGASLMTPDTLYVFFWTWAALVFWRAKDERRLGWWVLTGALVGLGMLSKYTAAVELLSFAAFCVWHRPSRSHLRQSTFGIMLGTVLLFLVPALVWNCQHGWQTIHWMLHRGSLDEQVHFRPFSIFIFLGEQAGVISLLLFIGLLIALCRPSFGNVTPVETIYVISLFLPLFLFYLILSVRYVGKPNWTAAAYISGIILLAAKWDGLARRHRWARVAAVVALVMAALETIALRETRWLQLPRGTDPLDRVRGFRNMAKAVSREQNQTGAHIVIANNYMTAALLSFYLPGQPETFVPITTSPFNQLELWPTYREKYPAGEALLITDRKGLSRQLREGFSYVQWRPFIERRDAGRLIKRYNVFFCRW
ncbi:MAG: ArnT family glycosyltransferase [Candidatus Udaeobacter sp.]